MGPDASTILHGQRSHSLFTVSGSVFHESATQVTPGKLPSASQIRNAIADVCLWFKQPGHGATVAQHGRGCRTDLHEADLTHPSQGIRIIATLNLRDRVRNIRRETSLLSFTLDGIKMSFAPLCVGLRQSDEAFNRGRQRNLWEISLVCLRQNRRSKKQKARHKAGLGVVRTIQ
jgi:hypothetical protein